MYLDEFLAEFDEEEPDRFENPDICLELFKQHQDYPILVFQYAQVLSHKFGGVIEQDGTHYFVYKNDDDFIIGCFPIEYIKAELKTYREVIFE